MPVGTRSGTHAHCRHKGPAVASTKGPHSCSYNYNITTRHSFMVSRIGWLGRIACHEGGGA
eukprot:9709141-Prorocentrum_lima.AAC.1